MKHKKASFMVGMLAFVIIAGTVSLSGPLLAVMCELGVLAGLVGAALAGQPCARG